MKTNKIWLVEWSPTFQQFHLETLDKVLEKNLRLFYNRVNLDWQPIAVISNLEEAQPLIERLERNRREYLPAVIRERLRRIVNRKLR